MNSVHQVYLNGEFVPAQSATISVFDRGFIFGDGVYEVIPAYGGRLFRFTQHMDRLDRSLTAIGLENPLVRDKWNSVLLKLISQSDDDQSIYLQVTRGVAARDHSFPDSVDCTVFVYAQPLVTPSTKILQEGVAVILAKDNRWQRCDIKAVSLLPNVLLRQQATVSGASEALLVRDGKVTEGAASNVFIVKHGVVVTPPKGPAILPGITRDLIVELATENSIPCREEDIPVGALRGADEVWLCSSTKEILPVTVLDGTQVGAGQPGPAFERMLQLYKHYKDEFRAGRRN
ncbi:MAG TPA: D-amino acid aminotransferase [Acidiferrobacteraceae bacterium]|nr:D-amino acid aminotransferase [Acidiferrobacteraceae bacterium]